MRFSVVPRKLSLLLATAVGASTTFVASAEAKPSTSAVRAAVEKKFDRQYSDDATAKCRSAGTASWSCQIRTEEDAAIIAESGGDGTSSADKERLWYSYSCTVRYSGGKLSIGSFREHDYDH